MPSVRVLKSFKRRGEIVPPGTIIDVPVSMLPVLAGYVEPLPRRRQDRPASYEEQLAEEAERRVSFCVTHARMLGTCPHFGIIEGYQPGDRAAALDSCLLWRLVRAGSNLERAGGAEIIPGVTVADVLDWVQHAQDIDMIRAERRLLLTCTASMRGTVLH